MPKSIFISASKKYERTIVFSLKIMGIIVGIYVLGTLIEIGYKSNWTGFSSKDLWDWMELLIVPLVLAIGGTVITYLQRKTENDIAINNLYERKLQAYFSQITEYILKNDLLDSLPDSKIRAIARAQTLTVLGGLDGQRKGILLRFLYENGLIGKESVIKLFGADLSGTVINSDILLSGSLAK